MITELERMENELRLAGYRLEPVSENKEWTDDDYAQAIGYSAWQVCKTFYEQNHSGYSAQVTIAIIKKLLDGDSLTPLTNNPDEWVNCGEYDGSSYNIYQSKRNFSCFSQDGLKTYYDIDAEENVEYELDEDGNKTGWRTFVGSDNAVKHELQQYEV